ncbi:MAG: hypothetical protein ACYDC2_03260 [Solirubrobacteraceae bacterium]
MKEPRIEWTLSVLTLLDGKRVMKSWPGLHWEDIAHVLERLQDKPRAALAIRIEPTYPAIELLYDEHHKPTIREQLEREVQDREDAWLKGFLDKSRVPQ